jgi:hypothetical protein
MYGGDEYTAQAKELSMDNQSVLLQNQAIMMELLNQFWIALPALVLASLFVGPLYYFVWDAFRSN